MDTPNIPFEKLLKIVAVYPETNPKIDQLRSAVTAEGFEVEVSDSYDRDVTLDSDVGAYVLACDGELHDPAREFERFDQLLSDHPQSIWARQARRYASAPAAGGQGP